MKKTHINDPFHNPFHNRFHVPVQSRLDEMQAHAQVIWLRDQAPFDQQMDEQTSTRPWLRAIAGAFALVLVVIFSAAIVSSLFSN